MLSKGFYAGLRKEVAKLGHQTQVKELLEREQILLSCINTMQDRFEEVRKNVYTDSATRGFSMAYLRAYEILTGSPLGFTEEEVDQVNPEELEGRDEK